MSEAHNSNSGEQRRDHRGARGERGGRRRPAPEKAASAFAEEVVFINRCAKVVKGGRRFSFAALVVSGDQKGRVGVGYGRSNEVPDAIRKGTHYSQRGMVEVSLRGATIPHRVLGVADGAKVLLCPASAGTGIIAGGGVRAVLKLIGVKDVLTKSLGSSNPLAIVRATINALEQLRTKSSILQLRSAEHTEE